MTLLHLPPEAVAVHVRLLASPSSYDTNVLDETVFTLEELGPTVDPLRRAATRTAMGADMFLDFLDGSAVEESAREPEAIVRWTPNQPDHTAYGPTYRWGALRLRAVRVGVPVDQP